jgi:tetrapyrrole methylase family protein/MazG family protein
MGASRAPAGPARPHVVVVGLGPCTPSLVPPATLDALRGAARCLVRTARHPSASVVASAARGPVEMLDHLYERAGRVDDVYRAITDAVVEAAEQVRAVDESSYVAYAVPGSPLVAERSVVLLRDDPRVSVSLVVAPSFLDLAWERLGIDPVASGVRIVDGLDFATAAAGDRGPIIVAQCHTRAVLSEIKLAADDVAGVDPGRRAVVLHHLGLADERVVDVPWAELDRVLEPDHLTALYVDRLAPPVAAELVALEELVRTLRERCPWDRSQTHGSLGRHLLEEAYETLDAIEAVAAAGDDAGAEEVAHLEEELGDLLFQIYFHALLGAEQGRFTLADVARTVHDKLVRRHPHVFGDASADTPEEVAARWETLKKKEKGRASVTDGIPAALPALALAATLLRKAESVGLRTGTPADRAAELRAMVDALVPPDGPGVSGETLDATPETAAAVGEMLFVLADIARHLGVDPETALRAAAGNFRRHLQAAESRPS